MKINHYQILGIQDDATLTQVKAAYRTESLIWHPDKAKEWANERAEDCAEIFKRISTAHEILSEPSKRQAYDTFLLMTKHSMETQDETAFHKLWIELKSLYETYKNREANPATFIAFLQAKVASQETRLIERAKRTGRLEHQAQTQYNENLKLKDELSLVKSELEKTRQAQEALQVRYNKLATATLRDESPVDEGKQSSQTLFAPAPTVTTTGKIIPKGLIAVYNLILDEPNGEKVFARVQLMFSSDANKGAFGNALKDYAKIPGNIVNINALSDRNGTLVNLVFMNCVSDRLTADNFRRAGALLMKELESVVDLGQLKPEFVDKHYKPISDEVLQQVVDGYKKSLRKK